MARNGSPVTAGKSEGNGGQGRCKCGMRGIEVWQAGGAGWLRGRWPAGS